MERPYASRQALGLREASTLSDPEGAGDLAKMGRALRDRTDQLHAVKRDLEAFAHSMAHDLRAPLRGIASYIRGFIEDHAGSLSPAARETLDQIYAEARRAERLITDLAAYSRVGQLPFSAAEIEMAELARSAFQDLVETRRTPGPTLHLGSLPPAYGDRAMVRLIWSHLLGNAIKFTQRRPDPEISITAATEGGWTTYCVADNGAGFEPRYAGRLFSVFQRLHRQEDFEGSGVGLAAVSRLVQRHGGRAWADGQTDRGAKIFFSLPIVPRA